MRLSFACGPYDRVRPIMEGRVRISGVDLTPMVVTPASALFWRMLRHEEFDISELSLSNYLMEVASGAPRFVAIPVFPHRHFRQSALWVKSDSAIRRPEDLAGARIGIPEYSMTMMLSVRGFLKDDHGVSPSDVTWCTVRPDRVEYPAPDVTIELAPPGSRLDDLLESGAVDAIVTTRSPKSRSTPHRRLFADPRAVEADYFRRTGIFPIMHVIVLRRAIYEENRWLVAELVGAFDRAKHMAYDWLNESQPYASLPWFGQDLEEEWAVFGGDPYPYGIEANRASLEAAIRWSFDQGLSQRPIEVGQLFPPEALEPFAHHDQR